MCPPACSRSSLWQWRIWRADLGVDPSKVVTVSAENVTWPDGAIGCPQPGMMYTQVQVDGAEIILQVDGLSYRYTLGGSKGPTLCTTG